MNIAKFWFYIIYKDTQSQNPNTKDFTKYMIQGLDKIINSD